MNHFLKVSVVVILWLMMVWNAAALTPPPGRFAYVANPIGDSVSVIDTDAWIVTATINVDKHPSGVAVGPGVTMSM